MTNAPTLATIAAGLRRLRRAQTPKPCTPASVNAFLHQLVQPVAGTENVGRVEALGRVLAGDVISPMSVPAARQLGHGRLRLSTAASWCPASPSRCAA